MFCFVYTCRKSMEDVVLRMQNTAGDALKLVEDEVYIVS